MLAQRHRTGALAGGAESEIFEAFAKHGDDYAARKACFAQLEDVVMEDAGHMMHHDQPEQLAQIVEAFLAPE